MTASHILSTHIPSTRTEPSTRVRLVPEYEVPWFDDLAEVIAHGPAGTEVMVGGQLFVEPGDFVFRHEADAGGRLGACGGNMC